MRISEYNIKNKNVGSHTFIFVSDLHDYPNEYIFDAINDIEADAILVPGDVIHNSKIYKNGVEFLDRAAKIAPVFFSFGNHEMRAGTDIVEIIKRSNARVLDNEMLRFEDIIIGGLSSGYKIGGEQKRFGKTPPPDTEWLQKFSDAEGYKILLSHHPEYYDRYIKPLKIDLVVSGHAHGGQVRLFGRGILSPGQGLFPKYTKGMYDNRLIVSSGIGNQVSVPRLNNLPEIVLIKINEKSK